MYLYNITGININFKIEEIDYKLIQLISPECKMYEMPNYANLSRS